MSLTLSDDALHKITDRLDDLATAQLTDAEIAALLNYALEDFHQILNAYPELASKIALSRQKGLAMLRSELWNKATTQKSLEAMKYLAAEYLNMGVTQQGGNVFEQRVNISPEKLKKIHDILTS